MRVLISLCICFISMAVYAGNFFPLEYKTFPFSAGDLLVSKSKDGTFGVTKVLKVERIDVATGSAINILGKKFIAPESDYLLVVSTAIGKFEFRSFEEAVAAAKSGRWNIGVGHAPGRAPAAAAGQMKVGRDVVNESELEGYKYWKEEFVNGRAGIF